jgi:hypothetical protein
LLADIFGQLVGVMITGTAGYVGGKVLGNYINTPDSEGDKNGIK